MPRHKAIFDTNPGVDDALALLYLHRHPEIDLLGITTVFGDASVEVTTDHPQCQVPGAQLGHRGAGPRRG